MKSTVEPVRELESNFVDSIVEIAAHLFAQRGYEGTSIRDISHAAKVSIPVIYHHFGSKEEFYNFVCTQKFEEIYLAVNERLSALPLIERNAAALACIIFDLLTENPDLYFLINRNMVNAHPRHACSADHQLYIKLRQIIDRTLHFSSNAEHGEALSYSFDSVVNGYTSFAMASNISLSREEHIERCREHLRWFVSQSFK